MENRIQRIELFFDQYAQRFNAALADGETDIEATAASFAQCFTEASPVGVVCGKNDDVFRQMIPKGYERYKTIGVTAMTIDGKDITLLDEFHAMARIHWGCHFTRKDGGEGSIQFDVIYFVQDLGQGVKIFTYITGDEQKALKDIGLI